MQASQQVGKPFVLIILDGWGERAQAQYNAIVAARPGYWNSLCENFPHTLVAAAGSAVGLPEGQIGNSEVGHLNIGAGRIVYQDFTRIEQAVATGEFLVNPVLVRTAQTVAQQGKALHILGLLSPGGVHSHESQLHAMLELAVRQGVRQVYVHAFLDGRDVLPKSALASLQALEAKCQQLQHGKIVSVIGRYYAMDRDQRWERTEQAYNLLALGTASFQAENAIAALEMAYARGESDEFVQATTIGPIGQPPVTLMDGDAVVFMNFRADRARQLSYALTEAQFTSFTRRAKPQLSSFVTLTEYAKNLQATIAYPPQAMTNSLGEYLAKAHLKQLRIAETEKYAHVTFFFNGGVEAPYPGEDRILVPSPKIATYDLQPEMSAPLITAKLVAAIAQQQYDVIICNFANPDMLGHTGDFAATIQAITCIDHCLQQIITALQTVGGEALITADHGNAECMYDEQAQQPHTAHTTERVPLLYVGRKAHFTGAEAKLADIAPTMLYLLGLPIPQEMTGQVLLALG